MPFLNWKSEYQTGINPIDFEHRKLVELINEIHEHISQQDEKCDVEDCLGQIHATISAHFALEEKVMLEMEFEHYEQHKAEHEVLLDWVVEIIEDFEDEDGISGEMLEAQLRKWFIDHVQDSDPTTL